ncbi:TetR family transcriptional regulator [Saccharothrix sp. NRRL B-16348]|uniref:TetR/AcrR family transcriptional regulator n=1 Tax=Saccharothrix sp. NRRL B-16348 TaxID=1415542 RepID=UPI0006AF21A7|nr:TetR/AcrR family transcriptional regulator [Saccharothrix sp. NRRL B-16348]KOX27508.1 TetR family transcriptional regulator [Saccharothrix sp. NRRL B-16348]
MTDKPARGGGAPQDVELARLREPAPRERADAARNRAKILDVAARLFARHGVAEVSMDQIAAAAEVGKGTLFRRFGDKAGLASALLGAREEELQAAILGGPPPLGPDAPAGERLVAFVVAYADFLEANLDLVRLSETASPSARYRTGAYRFWHLHVRILLAEARPDLDADYFAHALLAPLAADLRHATGDVFSAERVATDLTHLARLVLTGRIMP